jgi:murein L,D-transpeptidase YcbB/YkuD
VRHRLKAAGAATVLVFFAAVGYSIHAGGRLPDWAELEASAETESAAAFSLIVDVSDRKLYVMEGSTVARSFSVAVGKKGHPTPRGSYRIQHVVWNPRWVPPKAEWAKDKTPKAPGDPNNPMGKAKLFFKQPDYFIHGTNEPGTVGTASSHGCVRMRNEDVIELAKLVMKHGGQPQAASWYRRVLNQAKSQREVRLSQGVPVRIRD